jgi:hypothetical protein
LRRAYPLNTKPPRLSCGLPLPMRQRLISVYKLNVLVRLELKPASLVELTLAVGPSSSEASGKRLGHDKNLRLAAGVSSGNCIPSMRRHRGKPAVAPTILVNT